MNVMRWMLVGLALVAGVCPVGAFAAPPVITSFHGNGELTWTNEVNTGAVYRVEWASAAGGPWYQTFQQLRTIDAHTNSSFTVSVPMFYRVVMTTNESPQGMVWVDDGTVDIGQINIAEPVHSCFISGFWMDATEITIEEWRDVYEWAITNDYTFTHTGSAKTNNHPVHTVNWYDCVKWCNARSQKEGLVPCYYLDPSFSALYTTGLVDISSSLVNWNASGYRLPTESEWEKAARGGHQGRFFPWGGDTIQHARANYFSTNRVDLWYDTSPTRGYHPDYDDGVMPYTASVGSFAANAFGLHDMAGNVFEWCWDWHDDYEQGHQIDPQGPTSGDWRTFRSGSWQSMPTAYGARCAVRHVNGWPLNAWDGCGFRCVRRQ